ncbi:hypothetical protein BC567DRAFT_213265 [Phyllosticta citribraziliensis]
MEPSPFLTSDLDAQCKQKGAPTLTLKACSATSKSLVVTASGLEYHVISRQESYQTFLRSSRYDEVEPPCATLPLINVDDAEPLLHFVQYTAATLAGQGDGGNMCRILRFWERNAPQIGLRWPFAQHLILSVASFHLSELVLEQEGASSGHKKPDGDAGDPEGLRHPLLRRTRDEYLALAQHHFSSGLAGFTCLMAHPDTSNCGALYLSAIMVSYCTFAAGPTSANDLLVCSLDDGDGSEDHQSIPFVHGLRIIYASFTPEVLFAGLLAPLGPSGKGESPEPPLPVCIRDGFKRIDWEPALNGLRDFIGQSPDQEGFAACLGALEDLAAIFAANYGCGPDGSYHGEPSNQFVFGWLYRIRNDFVGRICARDPRALLLVAFYAVLLDSSTTVQQGWYIRRWSRHLVARVGELLPEESELEERMRWPREMTALEVERSGDRVHSTTDAQILGPGMVQVIKIISLKQRAKIPFHSILQLSKAQAAKENGTKTLTRQWNAPRFHQKSKAQIASSYFTGTWYEARDPVDHWVNHDVWPPNFAESNEPEPEIEPESENEPEEMSTLSRTPSARRQAKNRFSKEVWDIELPQAEINAPNTPDTRARLLKSQCVIDYWTKHSKMPKDGLTKSAEETCRRVLESSQTGPPRDADYFRRVSKRLQSKGETKVVQDIGPLVAPRVEPLYFGGDDSLEYLTESVDETWSLCVPILGPHPPRPDYAAGFHREIAFTERQLSVLKRFGNGEDDSLVRVTKSLSFPFFSFEAKAGGVDLAEAEQQNVEDALIASRGVIELFKRANLAHEIDREILAFSVVYNDHEVRIFAHFADVQRSHPRFYRHQIDQKLISQADCATHKMVNYIYKVWAREHWERICRAIDTLATRPGYTPSTSSQASVSVSGNRTPQSGSMGPPSEPRSASVPPLAPRPTSASNNVRSQRDLTPNTSPTRDTKKPKKSGYS